MLGNAPGAHSNRLANHAADQREGAFGTIGNQAAADSGRLQLAGRGDWVGDESFVGGGGEDWSAGQSWGRESWPTAGDGGHALGSDGDLRAFGHQNRECGPRGSLRVPKRRTSRRPCYPPSHPANLPPQILYRLPPTVRPTRSPSPAEGARVGWWTWRWWTSTH